MSRTQELIDQVETYGAHNYKPLPVMLAKGRGAEVWDVEGRRYVDFLAAYSALNFGHLHPGLVKALEDQLQKIAVTSRAFYAEELSRFSEELARFCGMETVLTMNSGAEAVESAIKVARKWGYQKKGIPAGRAKIVAMENNFHGRTVTIVSFSTEQAYRSGFGPFTPGFEVVPFGDLQSLEAAIDEHTVGVLLEPIQAEAGILIPPAGYLKAVRELCSRRGTLLILDEIQTGLGRTGRDFCYQHDDITPDMLVLGKSLGGGLIHLSAVVTRREVMDVLRPGEHGSTFGGNPLACAVGRAALELLPREKLPERARHIGERVMERLRGERLPRVKEIRGRGALIGIDLDESSGGARKYCEKLATLGVLCKETHDYVIRLAPPLVIADRDLDDSLGKIVDVIKSLG